METRKRRWKIPSGPLNARERKKAKARLLYLGGMHVMKDISSICRIDEKTLWRWIRDGRWDQELAGKASERKAKMLEEVADEAVREMRERQLQGARFIQAKAMAIIATGEHREPSFEGASKAWVDTGVHEQKLMGVGEKVTHELHVVTAAQMTVERRLGDELGALIRQGKIDGHDLARVLGALKPPELIEGQAEEMPPEGGDDGDDAA